MCTEHPRRVKISITCVFTRAISFMSHSNVFYLALCSQIHTFLYLWMSCLSGIYSELRCLWLRTGLCLKTNCNVWFTKYHVTNKCTNCMSFILNHFFKTLALLLHVPIAYRLSSSGSSLMMISDMLSKHVGAVKVF